MEALRERADDSAADDGSSLVHAYVRPQAHGWNAIAADYSIVGRGETPAEAVIEMLELLVDYLHACRADGIGPTAARRPLPWRWRLQLRLSMLAGRLKRLVDRAAVAQRDMDVFVPHQAH